MGYLFSQLAWVYATTNMKIQIDIFCRIIAGYIWEGKVLANIWFFNLGYISGIKGLAFAQDLKLGIYCNVSPAPQIPSSIGLYLQARPADNENPPRSPLGTSSSSNRWV